MLTAHAVQTSYQGVRQLIAEILERHKKDLEDYEARKLMRESNKVESSISPTTPESK